ncbi:Uncharacterized protein dnm_050790 [Desulfonema magnum]|uniref:Uncharacterized protein n=1 Tax=Desulfonema magnum TaxID=45655 RepID=A0A975BNY6_9BACT|nr:Uncharacterized protein dnm_050790 [Desulfonema magnum]
MSLLLLSIISGSEKFVVPPLGGLSLPDGLPDFTAPPKGGTTNLFELIRGVRSGDYF